MLLRSYRSQTYYFLGRVFSIYFLEAGRWSSAPGQPTHVIPPPIIMTSLHPQKCIVVTFTFVYNFNIFLLVWIILESI